MDDVWRCYGELKEGKIIKKYMTLNVLGSLGKIGEKKSIRRQRQESMGETWGCFVSLVCWESAFHPLRPYLILHSRHSS